jgi:hypothetical protein
MRTLILIWFWSSAINVFFAMAALSSKEFPYQQKVTLGKTIVALIFSVTWLIWCGLLLWPQTFLKP